MALLVCEHWLLRDFERYGIIFLNAWFLNFGPYRIIFMNARVIIIVVMIMTLRCFVPYGVVFITVYVYCFRFPVFYNYFAPSVNNNTSVCGTVACVLKIAISSKQVHYDLF